MAITNQAQLLALKADILADPALAPLFGNPDGNAEIAAAYNVVANPAFWVWGTAVTRASIYHGTSSDNTTWNWQTYKAQAVPEQNAWTQMFMGDTGNFSLPNFRAGVVAIFSGSSAQNAQQAHILAMGRRLAKRGEKLLAAGTGSTAVPATMTHEGNVTSADVLNAFNVQP